jgi:hypothetical protein
LLTEEHGAPSPQHLLNIIAESKAALDEVGYSALIAPMNRVARCNIYYQFLARGSYRYRSMALIDAFELLRASFNDNLRQVGQTVYPDGRFDFDTTGSPVEAPRVFTIAQSQVLRLLSDCDQIWRQPSNLLHLFGLPASRDELRRLASGDESTNGD